MSNTNTNTNVASLLSFLADFAVDHAAPIVQVWSVTAPELLAKRRGTTKAEGQFCPYKSVVRQAAGSFQLARAEGSYSRRIEAALDRLGIPCTFVAEKLWKGFGKPGTVPFTAEHTVSGEVYLVAYTARGGQPTKSVDIWTVDGVVLEGDALAQFKQDWLADLPKPSAKQADAGLVDPNKQTVPRNYHVENIVQIVSGAIGWSATDGVWGLANVA